ncbi:MAG: hypothetical protein GY866_27905 [Proteobacteria bacterium]|nr:hypothetical protein [Pseudomonadota bacterium]
MKEVDSHHDRDAIRQLIEDLQHGDERSRRYAAEDLGYGNYRKGIPHLVDGLKDESIAVSECCANALIKIGGSEVAEMVAPFLASENVRLRNQAAEILNMLGEAALDTLVGQLQADDRDVRIFSVDILVNIGSEKSTEALIEALDDDDVNVAAAAAEGLGKTGDKSHLRILESYIRSDFWMKGAVLRGIGQIGGSRAIDIIRPFVHDSDLMVKASAIKALTRIVDTRVISVLLDLLVNESLELYGGDIISAIYTNIEAFPETDIRESTDEDVLTAVVCLARQGSSHDRLKAIEVLGYMKAETVISALIDGLRENEADIRRAVVDTIHKIDPDNLSPFKKTLEDPLSSLDQKCLALECIGKSSNQEGYEIVKSFLDSEDDTLPQVTLDAIHSDFSPVPYEEIKGLLKSENRETRISAAAAIGRLNKMEFVDALIEQLKDADVEVQEAVDDALIRIGIEQEIPLLKPYLDSFGKSERKMAFEYFGTHHPETLSGKFIEGLQDPSVDIRIISFKVIANLKIATLKIIKQGIRDPVDAVQVQAVRTLDSLPMSREKTDFIKTVLTGTVFERVKVELIRIVKESDGYDVVDCVLPLLQDGSSWVRIEAVEALKSLGDASVVDRLKELLNSDNPELVKAVENAVDELES